LPSCEVLVVFAYLFRNPTAKSHVRSHMWRNIFGVCVGAVCLVASSNAQQYEKHFSVDKANTFDKVVLNFQTHGGRCYISPKDQTEALKIYSNKKIEEFFHEYDKNLQDRTYHINIDTHDKDVETVGQSISMKMFSEKEKQKPHVWKVMLSKDTPLEMDLTYGLGDAFIDLSGLGVEKLKVKTGSADVRLDYISEDANWSEMDTMQIAVDLGTLVLRNLPKARAKNIFADVGFGTLSMDLRETTELSSEVNASVGAGDLIVLVSRESNPIKVNISDSYLCKVNLSSSFKEIKKNTWVNRNYSPYADNLVTFNVDVSMGNIVFKEK